MMHYYKRCDHCKTVYSYQASGYGCHHENNSDMYCIDCMQVINDALKLVKPKFKDAWIETTEVTVDQLKKWEADKIEEHNKNNTTGIKFPLMKRVFAGTYNMETGDKDVIEHVDGRDDFKGREFIYSYNTKDPSVINITTRVELNIETGATKPWKEYK